MISKAYFSYFVNRHACDDRFVELARLLGMSEANKPEDFIAALVRLQEACGVADLKMSDYGITPDEFPQMARIAQVARQAGSDQLTTIFLKYKILSRAGEDATPLEQTLYQLDITSEVFLDNLKTATPWIVKVAGVELLRDQVEHGLREHMLHIATHFSNLVKVSENIVVRRLAGASLLAIAPALTPDRRNEVAVELSKVLETGQTEISQYIPQYLGQFALWLTPRELDEIVDQMQILLSSANTVVVAAALADPKVQKFTEGKKLVKTILVPNKLVNLIAK